MKRPEFKIGKRRIAHDAPAYIIAEVSCNHAGDFNEARRIVEAAAAAGVDAAKLQTYTADTMTRNFPSTLKGTMWENIDLYGLYKKAYTPWEWYPELKKVADDHGIDLFSSPFDETAVDFLMEQDTPVLKIASYEAVDLKLIEYVAKTGKPVMISNGMTNFLEMKESLDTLRDAGAKNIALLHCNSGYPARFEEVNLKTIPVLEDLFGVVVGLSDHTVYVDADTCQKPLAHIAPVEGVKLGARIVEFHLIMSRGEGRAMFDQGEGGFDWPFSKEPDELKTIVDLIRRFEKDGKLEYETPEERRVAAIAHGEVSFEPTEKERAGRAARPTLWVVEDIKAGEILKFAGGRQGNIDSIRPGGGLDIRFADQVHGCKAANDIKAGTPLSWDHIVR